MPAMNEVTDFELLATVHLSDKKWASACRQLANGEIAFVIPVDGDQELVLRQNEAVALVMIIDGALGNWRRQGVGIVYQWEDEGPFARAPDVT